MNSVTLVVEVSREPITIGGEEYELDADALVTFCINPNDKLPHYQKYKLENVWLFKDGDAIASREGFLPNQVIINDTLMIDNKNRKHNIQVHQVVFEHINNIMDDLTDQAMEDYYAFQK